MSELSHHPEILEAEVRRIRSETARNEAEELRLKLEAEEVRSRLSQKWYRGRFVVEAAVGGIVAAGLLAAWLVGFFQPMLHYEQDIATLENTKLKFENELQKSENEQQTRLLKEKNKAVSQQLKELEAQNASLAEAQKSSALLAESLKEKLQSLSEEYDALAAAKELSDSERENFARLARAADDRVAQLQNQIGELSSAQTASETRVEAVRKQQLLGKWYGVWEGSKNSSPYTISIDASGKLKVSSAGIDSEISEVTLSSNQFSFSEKYFGREYTYRLTVSGTNRMSGRASEKDGRQDVPYELIRDGAE